MNDISQKLADSLEQLQQLQESGTVAIQLRISVNPNGHFGFIRSLFLLLFRPCQFYLK